MLIQACVNGSRPAGEHLRLPVTPEQIARLDAATSAANMDLPGFRLHRLKGDMKGFRAVTVRANWRVIFRFDDHGPFDVDYLDYH